MLTDDSHGWYSIQLDNQAKMYFNGLGVPDAFQDLLFTSSLLQNGTHNLVLTNEPMYNSTAEYYKCEPIETLSMLNLLGRRRYRLYQAIWPAYPTGRIGSHRVFSHFLDGLE